MIFYHMPDNRYFKGWEPQFMPAKHRVSGRLFGYQASGMYQRRRPGEHVYEGWLDPQQGNFIYANANAIIGAAGMVADLPGSWYPGYGYFVATSAPVDAWERHKADVREGFPEAFEAFFNATTPTGWLGTLYLDNAEYYPAVPRKQRRR